MKTPNCGDLYSSPLLYFPEFLDVAPCVRHSVDDIFWGMIDKDDVVILGGGGLINNWINETLACLLGTCKNVICWSAGDHAKPGRTGVPVIDYERFSLLGSRDFEFTPAGYPRNAYLPYLPCVTCMEPELDHAFVIKRDLGLVQHYMRDLPDTLTSRYDTFRQNAHIKQSMRFIGESRVIVTNSYHAAYWGLLLNRKVIIMDIDWSHKFNYYKYKPVQSTGNLLEDIDNCRTYPAALRESRESNVLFYNRVKSMLFDRLRPAESTREPV